ncbi:MAG: quinolinate synthase NadA [Desulfovibrio sp.]|nr:MAG: quinolinate synthase NadA [Desulfovibrio sp.]
MTPTSTISQAKQALGNDLYLLGHHYQNDAVLDHVDLRGDSLELARRIPDLAARYIVFCGVFFMAESAAILATEGQEVHTPRADAMCVMAEMAPSVLAERVMQRFLDHGRKIIPLTYVNSSAAIKAMCGRLGGSVCTSANAATMLKWAMSRGDGVLFLPDKNLAQNTADSLGLPRTSRHILDIRKDGEAFSLEATDKTDLIMWPGCCAVHFRFRTSQIKAMRTHYPDCRVLVHPECSPEVVKASDGAGSTSYLIRECQEAPEGSTLVIGTEINLVARLAAQHAPGKTIVPLSVSSCANMAKTTQDNLAALLHRIQAGDAPDPVQVAPEIAEPAKLALERMLEVCA